MRNLITVAIIAGMICNSMMFLCNGDDLLTDVASPAAQVSVYQLLGVISLPLTLMNEAARSESPLFPEFSSNKPNTPVKHTPPPNNKGSSLCVAMPQCIELMQSHGGRLLSAVSPYHNLFLVSNEAGIWHNSGGPPAGPPGGWALLVFLAYFVVLSKGNLPYAGVRLFVS